MSGLEVIPFVAGILPRFLTALASFNGLVLVTLVITYALPLVSAVAADSEGSPLVTDAGDFRIRLPQAVIADILGLSIVHVSRTMTRLKEEGPIEEASTGTRYCDLEGLKEVALWEGLAPWFDVA